MCTGYFLYSNNSDTRPIWLSVWPKIMRSAIGVTGSRSNFTFPAMVLAKGFIKRSIVSSTASGGSGSPPRHISQGSAPAALMSSSGTKFPVYSTTGIPDSFAFLSSLTRPLDNASSSFMIPFICIFLLIELTDH